MLAVVLATLVLPYLPGAELGNLDAAGVVPLGAVREAPPSNARPGR